MKNPLKVVVSGGGIAGNVFLRQLLRLASGSSEKAAKKQNEQQLDVRAYEKRSRKNASPPGLNVLMNHNGMETLKECDNELYQAIAANGMPCPNWSARTVSGRILYDMENVVRDGMAGTAATLARWDTVHGATRVDDHTDFGSEIVRVEEEEEESADNNKLKVLVRRYNEDEDDTVSREEWITGIDYVVGCGGRYCSLRSQLSPPVPYYGPPYVDDFRIVARGVPSSVTDRLFSAEKPLWRVYNNKQSQGCVVRAGIMKLGENTVGIFGNVPRKDENKDFALRDNPDQLVELFSPDDDNDNNNEQPDELGSLVLDLLRQNGHEAHWTRKQQTDTVYSAMNDRVLFLGDSAGAIYPSLGQGANLSLEDAVAAAAMFPNIGKIASVRYQRREFIKAMSLRHAEHVHGGFGTDKEASIVFDREIYDWSDPLSTWRSRLLPRLWCGKQNALRAVTATKENILPYGQLIGESVDGDEYNESSDAVLDLSKGIPRLYMMKLEGGRPLLIHEITRHKSVTQCLGVLGKNEDFYLVVHKPCETPTVAGLQAFRIPPRHFVKLHAGTWHVGPMWTGSDLDRTFYNLELSDTNIADHTTLQLTDMLRATTTTTTEGSIDNEKTTTTTTNGDEEEADDDDGVRNLFDVESARTIEIPIFPVVSSR